MKFKFDSNVVVAALVAAIVGFCVYALLFKGWAYVLGWFTCGPQC